MKEFATTSRAAPSGLEPSDYRGLVAVGRALSKNQDRISAGAVRSLMRKHGAKLPRTASDIAEVLRVAKRMALGDDQIRRRRLEAAEAELRRGER